MTTPPRRRTSGGPVLQDDVTAAIEEAYFAELAETGYGRLSIDAVAKRAGVGKAAVYRRWRSKLDMTMALVPKTAVAAIDIPDTGTLRGDVLQYLRTARDALSHPMVRRIGPDLLAEAIRNPELAAVLGEHVREPRRIKAAELFNRAVERGQLPVGTDPDLALDLMAGPLYWRLAVMQLPVDDDYCEKLTDHIIAALH
ncbi:TetR/AcrR family transcriptional regulator [Mycolicibacterium sp. 120266]|uniref:TetR/AcrR family transcriptional regulator n=1 Tax=Mycolicibacterium sp. 120266 TaxID=3090601 RepID=UPI00299EAC1E|nr:TetR/AcrR family transcriptional regulator [Mycolicibacterium sp. 120266]MDX1874142.1 TetR/AcrR family transcriptional regulator [Mycolicibacterium sp. 120266]